MKCKLFVGFLLVLAAGFLPATLAAQSSVTPTMVPTPPGKLIVVNNGPGDQTDPHVSGDLVSYSNASADGQSFTIRYFNLAAGDAGVPNNGTMDFLADVRGTTIAFMRVSNTESSIFSFDTASGQLVEIAPQAGSSRHAAQIGDQTIAWQDFGVSNGGNQSVIVAYERATASTQTISPMPLALDQGPAISPDGTVVVWSRCATVMTPCPILKATLSNGNWTAQQLVSQVGGNQSHPDTDGTTIAYGANSGAGDQLVWQQVAGGTEQVLNLQGGNGSVPSISGGLIAFSALAAGATQHHLAIYDVATNTLYNVTADLTARRPLSRWR